MKSIAIAIAVSGCSPAAQSLCEAQAACGIVSDVDSCLERLQDLRDNAVAVDCLDEYYAFVVCQAEMDFGCSSFSTDLATACGRETCMFRGCEANGGIRWRESLERWPQQCASTPPPAILGRWEMHLTPEAPGTCTFPAFDQLVRIDVANVTTDMGMVTMLNLATTSPPGIDIWLDRYFPGFNVPAKVFLHVSADSNRRIQGTGSVSTTSDCSQTFTVDGVLVP
jgi:hypothetical protein